MVAAALAMAARFEWRRGHGDHAARQVPSTSRKALRGRMQVAIGVLVGRADRCPMTVRAGPGPSGDPVRSQAPGAVDQAPGARWVTER
jgi:hypothetical protein